ncbi:MAG TPA: energy-coupled thiamine transporter ThiT [Clostridiaceae bacterium]|nr:energy-coupled thiamine transporter ThiT [Clostridiaceae bacterium]
MKNKNVKMLAEAGIMIAIAQALSYVTVFQMPQGGSITPGSMIPIILFAIRWGPKKGILAGAVYGVLQFILGPKWSFHPVSLIFDYPVAFGLLGLAGLFRNTSTGIAGGTVLGVLGRFLCHVISGVVVFASYAPEGQHPLLYSMIYNGSFLLPELIISLVVVLLVARAIKPVTGI